MMFILARDIKARLIPAKIIRRCSSTLGGRKITIPNLPFTFFRKDSTVYRATQKNLSSKIPTQATKVLRRRTTTSGHHEERTLGPYHRDNNSLWSQHLKH